MSEENEDMTEDDRAVRILRTLPDEPPAPSTVDVARTMSEGRRRRRVRRWSSGVAMAAVTAVAAGGGTVAVGALRDTRAPAPGTTRTATTPTSAAAAAAPVPTGCTVTLLPTGGVAKALVTAGDPSGRHLAGRIYPPGGVRTVLWKDGVLRKLPAMPGGDASFDDINSSGVAVGSSYDDGDRQHAYVADGSSVTRLAGGTGAAVAVNDAGVIAGVLGDPGVPARWSSPRATPARLPLPAGFASGRAVDIDQDGTIVGTVERANAEGTGYLWFAGGTGRLMPLPDVEGEKATLFWPESMSDGWVYGRAVRDAADRSWRDFASYRYSIAENRYERLLVPFHPPALGAANGWVLGVTGEYTPVIVADRRVVKLPGYQKMKEYVVSSFSADGRVAGGYTTDSDGDGVANRPLRWTCR